MIDRINKVIETSDGNASVIQPPRDSSLKDVHQWLENELIKANCNVEIEVFVSRLTRRTTRLQRYFNSTPLRQTFARILVLAKCVNKHYTISEVAKKLETTRQSISILVNETEEEGWAEVVRQGNRVQFQATDELYQAHKEYVKWRMMLSQKYIGQQYTKMFEFEKLMLNHFTDQSLNHVKSFDVANDSYFSNNVLDGDVNEQNK